MVNYRIQLILTLLALCGRDVLANEAAELRPGATVRITAARAPFDIPGVASLKGSRLTPALGTRNLRDISNSVGSSEASSWWSLETVEGRTMVLPIRGQETEGVLVSMDEAAITIQRRDGKMELTLPLAIVQRIEVSTGHRSRAGQILKGAAIGAGAGAALGVVQGDDPTGWVSFSAEAKAVIFGVLFTPIGAIVGGARGTDRWEPVEPGNVRFNLTPAPKGVGVSVKFGFKGRGDRR